MDGFFFSPSNLLSRPVKDSIHPSIRRELRLLNFSSEKNRSLLLFLFDVDAPAFLTFWWMDGWMIVDWSMGAIDLRLYFFFSSFIMFVGLLVLHSRTNKSVLRKEDSGYLLTVSIFSVSSRSSILFTVRGVKDLILENRKRVSGVLSYLRQVFLLQNVSLKAEKTEHCRLVGWLVTGCSTFLFVV